MAFNPFAPLDDNLADAGDLVSVELFRSIAQNCNYLMDAMPIGSIIPVMVGFGACPLPDPLYWQLCDGSPIRNVYSPMFLSTTPNYEDVGGRYMRGYINAGTIGVYGGSNTKDLSHTHGRTSVYSPGQDGDSDNDQITAVPHDHGIPSSLGTAINFEPVHFRVRHYIKIV